MTRKFLDKVYDYIGKGVAEFYDDWATSYEEEVTENGYVTPGRCASALARFLKDKDAPILDFGCGTGLSGLALHAEGFTNMHGFDLSSEMLTQAEEKNLYRTLTKVELDAPLPVAKGDYTAIAAIGVIGPGAAPLDTFDKLVGLLNQGGLMTFSYNDHALKDRAYEARLNEYVDTATVRLLFRERGPHLPARNIHSTVYVIEKL